ncbi:MAG: family 10 glycosylhydrolase [Anaerolineales bacterium]|nr:family 10 glycosylhydrolase [Anaerolineales bacterium]
MRSVLQRKNLRHRPVFPWRYLSLFVLLMALTYFLAADKLAAQEDASEGLEGGSAIYLPTIFRAEPPPPPAMQELRGLWVTRFDWTSFGQPASPSKIDEIVDNADFAGFNAIFFQVRGTADAYYAPGLEPWAQRVSGGSLGQAPNPFWDPLAYFVQKAHAAGIELHAYINVYPVWDCGSAPASNTSPRHFYWDLRDIHGTTNGLLNGLQWNTSYQLSCSGYQRATPASIDVDNHLIAVGQDLVNRYDIDGIHLDHIRYGASNASCDPVSESRWGGDCFTSGYADWQRAQVSGTVNRFYDDIILANSGLALSAAVWPIYIDYWGWGGLQGYHTYYQDSKAWVAGGYIDIISPMIYPSTFNCPDNSFWTFSRWQTLVADFQSDANGRYVVPGIGTGYCTFSEIENRIEAARAIGTAGHALFSYSSLLSHGYFDDLANGPYAEPAVVPPINWHN